VVPEADAGPTLTAFEQAVLAATWKKLPTAPTYKGAKMDDLYFLSPLVGFAADGPGNAILKTEDGGATWKPVFTHPGTYFRAVLFLDSSHGFAGNLGAGLSPDVTDTTVLYETKDGGVTWAPVTAITGAKPSGLCNLTKSSATHLVGVGRANGPAHVVVSKDAGATWTSSNLGAQMTMLVDARFTSESEGLVVGMGRADQSCVVLRTTDGGATYANVFASKTSNSLCWKLSFPSDKVGYLAVQDAAGGPPTFAKTTDGGKTWLESALPVKTAADGGFPAIGVGFVTENVGWMSPEDATLPSYRTSDGGQTWQVDAALKSPINRFRFVDDKTAYAIGGSIWKLDIGAP
jgi:photosystem II stability/assembly factor-like uncharacterized protein